MVRVMASNLSSSCSYYGAQRMAGIAAAIAADTGRHELAQV